MGRIKIDYGIDLGTTNSALSRIEEGTAKVYNIDRSEIVPSCVAYRRNGSVIVGIRALNQPNCFLEFKRRMGTDQQYDTPNGEKVTPEDLSAELLKKLANEVTDEPFKSVVITVPAMFQLPQIDATKRAGEMAGFKQVEILMEPVAAAFAYGIKHKVKNGLFVVFDFGGGTFDAALVKAEEGIMSVVSSEGDNRLGGKDLDNAIINELLIPHLKDNFKLDNILTNDSKLNELKEALKRIADNLKIDLGKTTEFDLLTNLGDLPNDDAGEEMEIDHTFSRSDVDDVIKKLVQKAIDHTKRLLENTNNSIGDITSLILVGGPTQMPVFRSMIEEQLVKPDTSLNPMTAIAEGAALYASTINNINDEHGGVAVSDDSDGPVIKPIKLEVGYESTSNLAKEPVSIFRIDSNEKLYTIIKRNDGWESERAELDCVIDVALSGEKVNSFKIELYDDSNNPKPCTPNEFNIIPGIAVDGGSPLAYHVGMEVTGKNGKQIFQSFVGLEKDKRLPATGRTVIDLYTKTEIRPGMADDKIIIPIFQAETRAEGSRAKLNIYLTEIEITGLDVPKLIPNNTMCKFMLKIDISQNMTLEADFPSLEWTFEKTIKFPVTSTIESKQVQELLEESQNIIDKLKSGGKQPSNINELEQEKVQIEKDLNSSADQDGIDQAFENTKKLIIVLDTCEDKMQWPELQRDIEDSLYKLENLVAECVRDGMDGADKDQSDLDYLKNSKESVMQSKNIQRGNELLDRIRGKIFQIGDRHAGKDLRIAWIRDINNSFNSMKWTNVSQARVEVDKGMDLINAGASFNELNSQFGRIMRYMENPDAITGKGGIGQ